MKFIEFVKIGFAALALVFCLALQSKADDEVLVSQNGSAYFETDKYQISIILIPGDDVDSVIEHFDESPNHLKQMVRTKFTNTVKLNNYICFFIMVSPLVNEKDAQFSYEFHILGAAGDTSKTIKENFLQGNLIKGRIYRIRDKSIGAMTANETEDVGVAKIFIDIFDHKKKIKSVEMLVNVVN
ncbi:MAG: hypothetical protein LBC07_04330 [Elusimicrobiota bacterium]|jgi:hypothetical protein|nr:hypothetical protein [Elusimicrobiota bacterium]